MIRFFNGRTLTMAHGVTVTTDEVWTDGDKIAYIGPAPETLPAFEREIDLGGDLVMPGFKNAHAHAGMSFVRSYADDVPLQPWLFEQIFPLEAKLTPEAVYAFTKLSILEYLTSGITAGFDMYYFRDAIAQAGIDCGFRTVLCGGGGSAQQLEAEYRKFNALHPLISYQLGLHSEYTSNLTEMTEAGELARTLRAPVFAHNAETAREVAECRERWGKTPTELFESLGHFDFGGGGFHCVHMTEHDLEIFRDRGLWVITNPGSNAKLASGIAPLRQMRELGIRMAIGAKSWDIRWQFLMESLVLSLIGGLAGVILGVGGAFAVGYFSTLPAKVSLTYILLPFSFSGIVGLFFGFYPAYKASLLNPINALRYE